MEEKDHGKTIEEVREIYDEHRWGDPLDDLVEEYMLHVMYRSPMTREEMRNQMLDVLRENPDPDFDVDHQLDMAEDEGYKARKEFGV